MAAIMAISSLGMIYLSIFFLSRKDLEKNKLIREEENKRRYNIPLSSFSLIKELKFYALNSYFANEFEESNRALSNAMTTIQTRTQSPKFLVESALLIIVSIATLSIYASNSSSDKLELLSVLSSFGFAAYRIIPAIQSFFYGRSLFKFGSESFLVLYDEISESKKIEKVLVKRENTNLASINIQPYTYELGERKFKLTNKLEFFSGHSYLILGKSGLGKTTLIDNVSGLYKNDQISYYDKKGNEVEIDKINVGIVSQNTTVLDKPLFFNISLKEYDCLTKKEINFCNQLLDLVGLKEEVEERFITKDGVGEMGAFLSGGQKQRLAICRALFKMPNLLIFDETFSGIKEEMEGKILNSVKLLLPESILLIISHRNSTSNFVSNQIDLDNKIEVLE
jgi:ABC-type bacteriocin/lantibiotic exporter with double-glycine peptidase domain